MENSQILRGPRKIGEGQGKRLLFGKSVWREIQCYKLVSNPGKIYNILIVIG